MHPCAPLNSPTLTEILRPLMSYGKDERYVDKTVWHLPIHLFDPNDAAHVRLAEIGQTEAARIAALDLNEPKNFVRLRQVVRWTDSLYPDQPDDPSL